MLRRAVFKGGVGDPFFWRGDWLMASSVCYKSKLSSLRRKSKRPIVSIYFYHFIPNFCQYCHFLVMGRCLFLHDSPNNTTKNCQC